MGLLRVLDSRGNHLVNRIDWREKIEAYLSVWCALYRNLREVLLHEIPLFQGVSMKRIQDDHLPLETFGLMVSKHLDGVTGIIKRHINITISDVVDKFLH